MGFYFPEGKTALDPLPLIFYKQNHGFIKIPPSYFPQVFSRVFGSYINANIFYVCGTVRNQLCWDSTLNILGFNINLKNLKIRHSTQGLMFKLWYFLTREKLLFTGYVTNSPFPSPIFNRFFSQVLCFQDLQAFHHIFPHWENKKKVVFIFGLYLEPDL